jgi:teichuronic acid biosynthesis glycosyltransferase TuaG
MPNYNGERFIERAINSVIDQSYFNWELIIVDDNSKDKSIEIINIFLDNDKRIHLYKLDTNNGSSYARNFAIKKANGRYIAFLDCDDIWFPLKLHTQLALLKNKDCALTYSSYNLINDIDTNIGQVIIEKKNISYNDMLLKNHIGCLTAIYDTEKVGKMYMDENLKSHEDWLLWLNILENHSAFGIDEVLASYRIVNNSLSSRKLNQVKNHWFFLRKKLKISFYKSLFYFITYSVNGLKKKINLCCVE